MGKGFRKEDYKSGLFILSDASEVLREQNSSDWLEFSNSGRSKKIIANQVRSLRMRNFHGFLERVVSVSYTHLTLPTNREV